MPRTRIKICGVRDAPTALAAAAAGADAVGLVFVDQSPRVVDTETARAIATALPAFVEPVGLFSDAPADAVRDTCATAGLRTVQLHGAEGADYINQLPGLRILKALPFATDTLSEALASLGPALPRIAGLLLDTPPAADAKITGGSGHAFDWPALADVKRAGLFDDLPPIILAGGLTPDNVAEAIRVVRPYAVDVSSGVEAERGVKDPAKIAAFCRAVREAENH